MECRLDSKCLKMMQPPWEQLLCWFEIRSLSKRENAAQHAGALGHDCGNSGKGGPNTLCVEDFRVFRLFIGI